MRFRRYDPKDMKPDETSGDYQPLAERLRPQIVGVLRRLLDEVRGAELAVLNTNEGYGQVFERIMRIWEEALRQEVVEALWQDGEQQHRR